MIDNPPTPIEPDPRIELYEELLERIAARIPRADWPKEFRPAHILERAFELAEQHANRAKGHAYDNAARVLRSEALKQEDGTTRVLLHALATRIQYMGSEA